MIEKEVLVKQLQCGMKYIDKLDDFDTHSIFIAIYLADNDTLRKFVTNKEALNPFIEQAEDMKRGEASEILSFFVRELLNYATGISDKNILPKVTEETIEQIAETNLKNMTQDFK